MKLDDKEIEELKVRYRDARSTYLYFHKILMTVAPGVIELSLPIISSKSNIDASFIVSLATNHFRVDVKKKTRKLEYMRCRHACGHLLRKYTKLSWSSIAIMIGQGDHTSALHSDQTCKKWMMSDSMYKDDVVHLENLIELAIKTNMN